jgi:hypothetical protein
MDKNKFFEYFMNASIEEQVEIFNGLKKAFESVLQSRSAETEKHLFYLREIYKSHFDNGVTGVMKGYTENETKEEQVLNRYYAHK